MCMKNELQNWKLFKVETLFTIKKGKTLSVDNKSIYAGDIPCINGSAENNGVMCYLNASVMEIGFTLFKAPALSLSRVGNSGKTFFQSKDFFVADNAFALKAKEDIDARAYIFLSTVLNLETPKYAYGRPIKEPVYKLVSVLLPATYNIERNNVYKYSDDGYVPDWAYMCAYIDSLKNKPITTKVKQIENVLDTSTWTEFSLGKLFKIEKGKRLTKADMIEGSDNYLGAIDNNNGVRQKILAERLWKPNCITVNYNGSVGEAFYQSEPFWASDDVNVLYPNGWELNKYIGLFIATVIKAERPKYNYGRKWKKEIMEKSIIKLPTNNGKPDYVYMENFIKSLPYSDRI